MCCLNEGSFNVQDVHHKLMMGIHNEWSRLDQLLAVVCVIISCIKSGRHCGII